MDSSGILMVVIIFSINIVYVTFFTLRMILTLKGYRYIAALISMVEVVIYIVGLGLVLDNLNEIQNLSCLCSRLWHGSYHRNKN